MSELKLSKNQELAIKTKDKNILVSAAAGAGKTFVLVKRIIKMIKEDFINIDSLLIVTFSQAAAREMRERIGKAINAELKLNPYDKNMRRQALLLNKASISTIDAFCGNVVRNNFYKTDIDPGYRILSDSDEINKIRLEVIDELFNRKYEDDDTAFIQLVDSYCSEYKDDKIVNMILSIYDESCNNPYPLKWLEMCRANYNISKGFYSTPAGIMLKEKINIEYKKVKDLYCDIENLKENTDKAEYIKKFCDYFDNTPVENMTLIDIPVAKNHPDINEVSERFYGYYIDAIYYINKIFALIPDKLYIETVLENQKPLIDTLIDTIIEFSKLYKEKKLELKAAEFNDIQHYALEILKDQNGNPTEVALALKNKYTEIIIDEYQDSNNLQEEIFTSFARGNNMFMVGDIKQSIYRFRQANPELFKHKYDTFPYEKDSILIQLSENYRSKSCVIDFCNHIFSQLMTNEFGEIDYTDEVALKSTDKHSEIYYNTDIHILEPIKDLPDDFIGMTNTQYEANYIADVVENLLSSNKDINPGDIAILTREKQKVFYTMLNALTSRGIPASAENISSFNSTLEIQTIIALLKILDNPYDNIPLITVLHSHIYNINDDELVKIRLCNDSRFLYDCVEIYAEQNNDELSVKLINFINELNRIREFALNNTLTRLLSFIYDKTGYYTYVNLLPEGEQRQANLKLLTEIAENYEKYNTAGLKKFIEYIEGSDRINEATITDTSESTVKIVTMHSSKGLEYPIVILGFLGDNIKRNKLYPIIHHKSGFALKYVKNEYTTLDNPLGDIFKNYINEEDMSEALRLLYVALTRAKKRLILTGVCPEKDFDYYDNITISNPISYCLTLKRPNYLSFIMSALIAKNFEGANIYKIPLTKSFSSFNGYIKKSVNITKKLNSIDITTEYSGRLKEINDKLNYIYHNAKGQNLPAKISISEIKRMSKIMTMPSDTESIFKDIEFPDPEFLTNQKKELKGSERGTIYHCLFEHMDFLKVNTKDDINKSIKTLVNNNILTQNEADIIDIKKIEAFIKSDLYKRIQKSEKHCKETSFMMELKAEEIYGDEYKDSDITLVVHGIIDLYFIEKGKIILVDYKTDRVKNHNLSELTEKYKIQLELYKKALERNTGITVAECIIYSVSECCELLL